MQVLRPGFEIGQFMQEVSNAPQHALLLDYDGTLAPFRVERDQAVPYPGVLDLLSAIIAVPRTRVVVISGRWTQDLLPLLPIEPRPEIWGSHGWERLHPDGTHEHTALDARAAQSLADAYAWAKVAGLQDRCEQKPTSLAMHWRGLPQQRIHGLREAVLAAWVPLAEAAGLIPHEFDGGIELRAPGRDKGFALTTLLGELGADAAIAYLGDDMTDEDAFRALSGKGLGVLVRPELRPTEADLWIRPPDELLEFLALWLDACSK
jgi:trehalose 6-phosphate phosphatase